MDSDSRPLYNQPQYMQGQILALQALVIALARVTTDLAPFREEGLRQIELLKTALLPEPVSDAQVHGIHAIERWLEQATE